MGMLTMFCCKGGKLVYHYQKKPVKAPRCGDCGEALAGVSHQQQIDVNVRLWID